MREVWEIEKRAISQYHRAFVLMSPLFSSIWNKNFSFFLHLKTVYSFSVSSEPGHKVNLPDQMLRNLFQWSLGDFGFSFFGFQALSLCSHFQLWGKVFWGEISNQKGCLKKDLWKVDKQTCCLPLFKVLCLKLKS